LPTVAANRVHTTCHSENNATILSTDTSDKTDHTSLSSLTILVPTLSVSPHR